MILSKPYEKNALVKFESKTATINPFAGQTEKVTGNCHIVEGTLVALFCEKGVLTLQVGLEKWDLSSKSIQIKYLHDVPTRSTYFEVNHSGIITSIRYKAWWADIPGFLPVEPEMDEDEDFMGYIYAVWKNEGLQNALIAKWN